MASREICCGHLSDCAVHNEPAYPAGPCSCGFDSGRLSGIEDFRKAAIAECQRQIQSYAPTILGRARAAGAGKILNALKAMEVK